MRYYVISVQTERDPARYNFTTDFHNLQFLSSCVFMFDDLMMAF
jgi:hypothetical protein